MLRRRRKESCEPGQTRSSGFRFTARPDPERLGALERYLRDHKPTLAPSTAKNEPYYAKHSRNFSAIRASATSPNRESGNTSQSVMSAGQANATINKELRILIAILKRAKRWHLFSDEIRVCACAGAKSAARSSLARNSGCCARARRKRVVARAPGDGFGAQHDDARRRDPWFAVARIDWLERTLHVRRGKTDESQREIWLNDDAFSAITQLREESKEVFGEDLAPEWYLFFSWPRNREPDPTRAVASWRTAWRRMTRSIVCPECALFQDPGERCANEKCAADIRKVRSPIAGLRFHDLRHQAITELSEGGASDETIMSIAGHVDRRMMSHYSHIRKQARREALKHSGKKEGAQSGHSCTGNGAVGSGGVPASD